MKTVIASIKPRNPFVAPARFRRAGSHRPRPHTQRQIERRALRRELDAIKEPGP
jgi:hypothetical protein